MTSERVVSDDFGGDRALALFVAERLLEQPVSPRPMLGPGDLAAFLLGDTRVSAAMVNRALMARPSLRADLAALRERLARLTLPAVAAASDGDLDERPLPGGSLTLYAPPGERSVYLSLRLEDAPPPDVGLSLLLVTEAGEILAVPVPPFNDEGTVTVILNSADAGDAALLAALRSPRTLGDFIERRGVRDE